MVPDWFFMVLMVFQGSRLVCHGFWSVRMVFHGSRLVFQCFRSVLMVFHGPRLDFHVFVMAPGLVFMMPGGFVSS